MSTSVIVKKLEEQLKDAGKDLLSPPSSFSDLLSFLDRVHNLLSSVEQAPSKSVQDALFPLMTALISNELLRHSEMDVKVSVLCCITEITRITAPDAPYDDEQMKEIFRLTVAAFEKLSHVSGRCYTKAMCILETVARVRSSLMMLDLECDALVIEMFQHFLNTIRSNHPHAVFSAMERIMILIVEESEEISLDLLRPLLSSVRKEDQKTSPISWTLGQKVITNCAAKLRPCLMEAVKSKDIALVDYAQIVATICENGSGDLKNNFGNDLREDLEKENKLEGKAAPLEPANYETEELAPNGVCPEKTKTVDGTSKSVGNDAAPTRNDDVTSEGSSKKLQRCRLMKHFKKADSKGNAESDNTLPMKEDESETEPDSAPKKRGRRPNSLMNPEEGYDHSWICSSKRTRNPPCSKKSNDNDSDDSPSENPVSSKVMTGPPGLQPKGDETTGAAPSENDNLPDGSCRKRGRPKKGRNTGKELEGTSIMEGETQNCSKEIGLVAKNKESAVASAHVIAQKKAAVTSHPDEEPLQQSIMKLGAAKINKHVPVLKGTKHRRKVDNDKDANEASGIKIKTSDTATKPLDGDKNVNEASGCKIITSETATGNKIVTSGTATKPSYGVASYMEGTHKTSIKRKHIIGKEEASEISADNEELVGCRIKVWWPLDKMFYEGVVHSYDPVKKRHKVLYDDGDEERLNLKKEQWELIGDRALPDEGQKTDILEPDASFDSPKMYRRKPKSVQAKPDSSSTRRGASSCKSGKKYTRLRKSAALNKPTLKDEQVDDPSAIDDRPEDDGKLSTGKQKEDRQEDRKKDGKEDEKTSLDPRQTARETIALPNEESPKGDIESSSKECANKDAKEESGLVSSESEK
nr:sister chromatid cohesion protein PDS5 homolog C isoform X2 [Ziziphus jujuba var. spinosa]